MKIKHLCLWAFYGALFGLFFGAVASIFEPGPTATKGMFESWWWFALIGLFKAATDIYFLKPSALPSVLPSKSIGKS